MEFLSITEAALEKAARIIGGGGLAAFPTETVYGLGADAFNPGALAKVFAAKNRPRFDPLIIHIAALQELGRVADLERLKRAAREQLAALAETFWPGPLTLVLPKQSEVPDLATSGLVTAAVRMPDHPAALRLISLSGTAIAAPSANPFGYLSPTRAEHVRDMLGDKVDIILDGGAVKIGVESTVLDLCGEAPRILRPGGTSREAIEACIGAVDLGAAELPDTELPDAKIAALLSPGQLKSHYAPRARLSVYTRDALAALPPGAPDSAFLFFDGAARERYFAKNAASEKTPLPVIRTLSEQGSVVEAAANLFEMLHELDNLRVTRIYAQLAPDSGLGCAINDRLHRAAAR